MSNKGIIVALVVLVGLVIYLVSTQNDGTGGNTEDSSPALEKFLAADLSKVAHFTIEKGKDKVDAVKKDGGWVLESSYGYPGSQEKIDRLFEELGKIDGARRKGWNKASHADFEVDSEKGARVTLFDEAGTEMASIVLGRYAQSRLVSVTRSFVRFGDEDFVYEVAGSARSNAGGSNEKLNKDYLLHDKLFEIPEDSEIFQAVIARPDKNIIVERRWIETPKEKKDNEKKDSEKEAGEDKESGAIAVDDKDASEKKKEEVERVQEFHIASGSESFVIHKGDSKFYTAKNYLGNKSLRIKDAADPGKDLSEYGLDKPQLEVTLKHGDQEKPETVVILFGNAIKDEDSGDDKAYYVTLAGDAGPRRIYTVEKWTYNEWAKELKDFKEAPKKKDEKKEEKKDEKTDKKMEESGPATSGAAGSPDPSPTVIPAPTVSPPASSTSGERPEKVRASHILIPYKGAEKADASVTRSKEEARKEAERILALLKKDGSRFAELAKAHSSCSSSENGGDLGVFTADQMVKPFSDVAFSLKVGEISGVVETRFGFHVIQRTE